MRIRRFIPIPSLPLLGKDLIEIAARKRTYLIRTVAAALLFLIAMLVIADELNNRRFLGPTGMLGLGAQMVEAIFISLLTGVYLLLPAAVCPAIASERASGTLTLLRVSPLRPWQIVFQKYVARLIPVLSLILLAMPLMAVAYLYGGLERATVFDAAVIVLLSALQVAAVALMCSAYFRTPGGAFVATYLVLGVISWLWPAIAMEFSYDLFGSNYREAMPIAALFCPPLLVEMGWMSQQSLFWWLPYFGIVGSTGACLLGARVFLTTRADARRRNLLLKLFRALDAAFKRANAITGHKTIVADRRSLPDDEPIAWSEMHRRAIGKVQYLFRFFIALEIPAGIIALIVVYAGSYSFTYRRQFEELSALLLIAWAAYVIILTIIAAGVFESERSRQTLDVLLTTPIETRNIVRQKLAGLNRLRVVLLMPIVTLALVQAWAEWDIGDGGRYLVITAISLWVYPSLAIWVALWVGLRCRRPARAMLISLIVNTAIALGPVLLGATISILTFDDEPGLQIAFSGPVMLVVANEFNLIEDVFDDATLASVIQLGFWAIVLVLVRASVFHSADRMLGRVATAPYVARSPTPTVEPA